MNIPRLIVIAGKAGTGKTTLALAIAQQLHIPYFDYDTLVQPFLEAIETKYGRGGNGKYAFYHEWRNASYGTLWGVVKENLRLGNDVILSAPLTKEMQNPQFPEVIKGIMQVPFSLLVCYMAPPLALHHAMLTERGSKRDEEVLSDEQKFSEVLSPEKPRFDGTWLLYLDSGDVSLNRDVVIRKVQTLDKE